VSDVTKALLCDPQTSGGLLVACTSDTVDQVMQIFHAHGFGQASVIGELAQGTPGIQVI
jgi:selenide,water dikinase